MKECIDHGSNRDWRQRCSGRADRGGRQEIVRYGMPNCNPCVLPMAVGSDLASIPLLDVPDKDVVVA